MTFTSTVVDRNIALLAYQINEFIETEHRYENIVLDQIKNSIAFIVIEYFRVSFSDSTTRSSRSQSRSRSVEASSWSSEWSIDRVAFRQAIRSFEQKISVLTSLVINTSEFDSSELDFSKLDLSELDSSNIFFTSPHSEITEEISRSKMSDNRNEFSETQKREMTTIIVNAIAKAFRNHVDENDSSSDDNENNSFDLDNDNEDRRDNDQDWKTNDVEYFDLEYEGLANMGSSIVNVDRHVFYRDVYVFVNRLKNMTSLRDDQKLRTVVSQCLREFALIWHFMKLSELEKARLRNSNLNVWYESLIARFKKRTSIALSRLQRERYTMTNIKQQKNSRLFTQNIFRYAKTAKMSSTYNSISIAWNNLNWEFRRDISKPNSHTTIRLFLDQLNSKLNIWFEMIRRTRNDFSNQRNQFNFANFSKYERRQARDDVSQSSFENVASQYSFPPRSQGWTFYQFQNLAYQTRNQSFNFEQIRSVVALPPVRQSLLIIFENGFDFSSQN